MEQSPKRNQGCRFLPPVPEAEQLVLEKAFHTNRVAISNTQPLTEWISQFK